MADGTSSRRTVTSESMSKPSKSATRAEEPSLQGVELSQNMFILKNLRNFLEYDVNGDGVISFEEMKAILKHSTVHFTERDLRTVLKQLNGDQNGDGSVCFEEYLNLAQRLSEIQNKTKMKTSRIARAYLEPILYAQYVSVFHSAAGDDGTVSLTELQELMQRHNLKVNEDRMKAVMKELDDNESGSLELDEFLILLVKGIGVKKRKVGPDHCSASQLREEGWVIGELKRANYDCAALREAGYTPAQLMDVCTARELLNGGVPARQLLAAGWDCKNAREAGFKIADLVAAGATVQNLRTGGFTDTASVAALRKLRVEAWKMKLGGFSLSDLRNGGYSSAELRIAGFSGDSIAALEKLQNRLKNRSPLNRINTQEFRREAEMKLQEANMDSQVIERSQRSHEELSQEISKEMPSESLPT